ncbi:hypothetical protein FSP39_025304 [Pinctada imbricata]|uniref:Ribosyldihydronicotinamide dehydrogenase [quinone] n=1 Tax=Pinctada imbricata TaxID=66713 RepID=A0AA88XH08_PINIB|nr:hypothetical protein FSP39_025304 [Pinctada imbricata]
MTGKNVLIVFAHQDPNKSFNAALKDVAVKTLEDNGCKVQVSDLYSQNWDPRATKNDFTGPRQNEESFSYIVEQSNAAKQGKLTEVILAEQKKLKEADLVIFQFPVYWFSLPAILKGWFDKVLAGGITHSYPANVFENGLMKGKKAVLSFTTGGSQDMYTSKGTHGDIGMILYPIQWGTLRFVGFDVLKPNIAFSAAYRSKEDRKKILDDWKLRLQKIFQENAIQLREK